MSSEKSALRLTADQRSKLVPDIDVEALLDEIYAPTWVKLVVTRSSTQILHCPGASWRERGLALPTNRSSNARRASFTALLLLYVGCHRASTKPDPRAYSLIAVGSQSLPAQVSEGMPANDVVLSGSIVLLSNTTYRSQTVLRQSSARGDTTRSLSGTGTYTQSGRWVRLYPQSGGLPLPATITDSTLEVLSSLGTQWTYRRTP